MKAYRQARKQYQPTGMHGPIAQTNRSAARPIGLVVPARKDGK
jgi:hypothetical protein